MATLDSGLLMSRMLRAIVDLVIGPTMDLVTTSPAPVQAPSSSMNVEVNVSAVNPKATGWWHANEDQGWWAWNNSSRKAISYEDNADDKWKQSSVGHKSWKGQEHSHLKPLQDQQPPGKGNSKR